MLLVRFIILFHSEEQSRHHLENIYLPTLHGPTLCAPLTAGEN